MAIPRDVLECRWLALEDGRGGSEAGPVFVALKGVGLGFDLGNGTCTGAPAKFGPDPAPGLRCMPPAGTLGIVDKRGFRGKEEGKTVSGAEEDGFCSIWRSFASRAAILSFVLQKDQRSWMKKAGDWD